MSFLITINHYMNKNKNIKFIRDKFGSSDKDERDPAVHAKDTADYLIKRINEIKPDLSENKKKDLYHAGLGHDLLEDTDATAEEIRQMWGEAVLQYIKQLTNEVGDHDFSNYLAKLQSRSEEVLLIKFADIYSNVSDSVEDFDNLDQEWVKDFWLPLLGKYRDKLFDLDFIDYPQIADSMMGDIEKYIRKLEKMLKS